LRGLRLVINEFIKNVDGLLLLQVILMIVNFEIIFDLIKNFLRDIKLKVLGITDFNNIIKNIRVRSS
jgi:hypothetical protein